MLVATPLSLTNFSGALARASQYLVITHCLSDINSLLSCGRVGFAYHSLLARPGGVRYISSYQAAAATPATALRIWEERYPSGYAAVAELEQGLQEKIMNIVTTGPATNLIQSHFDYLRIIAVSKYPFLILFKFYTCIRNLICRVNILPYLNWSKFGYLDTPRNIFSVVFSYNYILDIYSSINYRSIIFKGISFALWVLTLIPLQHLRRKTKFYQLLRSHTLLQLSWRIWRIDSSFLQRTDINLMWGCCSRPSQSDGDSEEQQPSAAELANPIALQPTSGEPIRSKGGVGVGNSGPATNSDEANPVNNPSSPATTTVEEKPEGETSQTKEQLLKRDDNRFEENPISSPEPQKGEKISPSGSASTKDKEKEQGSDSNNDLENSKGKGKAQRSTPTEKDEDILEESSNHSPAPYRSVAGPGGDTSESSDPSAVQPLGSGSLMGRKTPDFWKGSDVAEDKENEDKFYRESRDKQLWGDFNYNSVTSNGETSGAGRGYSPENEQESDYDADTEHSNFNPKDSNRDMNGYGEEAEDPSTSVPLRSAEIEWAQNNYPKESGAPLPHHTEGGAVRSGGEENSSSLSSKDKGKGKAIDRDGDSSNTKPVPSDAETPTSTEEEVEKIPASSTEGSASNDYKNKDKAKEDIESSNTTPLTTEPMSNPAETQSGNGEEDEDPSGRPFSYLPTRRAAHWQNHGDYWSVTPRPQPDDDWRLENKGFRDKLEREYQIAGAVVHKIDKPIQLNTNISTLKEHESELVSPPVASTSGSQNLILTLEAKPSLPSEEGLENAVGGASSTNNMETPTNTPTLRTETENLTGPATTQQIVTDDASEPRSASGSADREEEGSADKNQISEAPHKKESDNNKKDGSDSDSNSGSPSGSADNGSVPPGQDSGPEQEPGEPSGDLGPSAAEQGTPPAPLSSPSISGSAAAAGKEGLAAEPGTGEANLEDSNYYSLLFYFLNIFNFLIEILTEIFLC